VYDHGVNDAKASRVTGFVLAGGKSTRMGSDKAFLEFGDETLLSRALQQVSAVAQEVKIVGQAEKLGGFGVTVEDLYPERGPLGGIHGALTSTSTELNLMLAVDMPFVEATFLEYLIAQARESGAVVTVPHAGGGFQPLCAIYRREFAAVAEESLREGRNKINPLFERVATRVIEESELVRAGFSAEMFRNLNTPQDFEESRGIRFS
jgi:molybdopterin-guanine dinucleotide biosynthesis protein A